MATQSSNILLDILFSYKLNKISNPIAYFVFDRFTNSNIAAYAVVNRILKMGGISKQKK